MERIASETYDRYIKALMDISGAITSDLYLDDLLKLIVTVTANATGVQICSLWLIDETCEPPVIRLKASQAIDPEYVNDRVLNMDEGVVGHVITTNKPFIVKNVLEEPRFKEKETAKKLGLVSMVGVPLQEREGKVIGVLNCFTAVSHSFLDTEINLIRTVANQAAIAIMNTELMVKIKAVREELEVRKLMDRAKDVLILRRNISVEEAHRWIQKKSMDMRKPIRNVVEDILLSKEFDD
ncbi:GAF and ANTAR domain-containing protein [Desulfobacterales bacterium HSG16]|nr:GAF and ANTAR domain-containing protein [Desulfobacterales bacterium HSG16]